jgi:hypothetical protein
MAKELANNRGLTEKNHKGKKSQNSTHYDFSRSNVKALLELYSWREKPMPIEFIDEFADALVEYYYEHPEVVTWERFYNDSGVYAEEVDRWADRSPKLQRARELVKSIITDRMETISFAHNPTAVFLKSAHWFSKRWKEIDQHWAEINKKDSNATDAPAIIKLGNPYPNQVNIVENK